MTHHENLPNPARDPAGYFDALSEQQRRERRESLLKAGNERVQRLKEQDRQAAEERRVTERRALEVRLHASFLTTGGTEGEWEAA